MKKILDLKFLKLKEVNLSLFEVALMAIFFLTALLFHERPKPVEKIVEKALVTKEIGVKKTEPEKPKIQGLKPYKKEIAEVKKLAKYKNLAKRNPFTPHGPYADITIPEIPYTLVAVKLSKPNQALLKLFTEEFIVVKEGDELIDGSKVVKIKEKSVIIKRLNKEKELFLLNVEVDKWKPKKSF